MEVTTLSVVQSHQQQQTDSSDTNNIVDLIQKQTNLNNSSPSSDELVNRNGKKLKKRDKSPSTEICSNETVALTTRHNNTPLTSIPNSSLNNNVLQQQQQASNTGVITNTANNNKKEKQRPETWNKIEQQIFFNALRENGKNFESITQYFNARQKRYKLENHDGQSSIQRSKEQIRHFYYRTWHKIVKYVSVPILNGTNSKSSTSNNNTNTGNNTNRLIIINDMNTFSLRDIQVKCLIAYNTLMNKSHRWNKKSAIKLVELINQGWTTIREKGKITRLRMPICKVSSKPVQTNDLQEINSNQTVNTNNNNVTNTNNHSNNNNVNNNNTLYPRNISIHFEPKNEHAYCKVHRLAQNPFLNIEIQTEQSVKFLIEFLENKWKDRRIQFLEKFQINPKKSSVNESSESNEKKLNTNINYFNTLNEKLVIYPSESHQILNNLDFFETSSCSTLKLFDEQKESNNEHEITNNKQQFNDIFKENDEETMMIDDYALIAAKKNSINHQTTTTTTVSATSKKNNSTTSNRNYFQLTSNQLKSGLTMDTSYLTSSQTKEQKELTFIQIYLAFNKPNQIKFEYDWISSSKQQHQQQQQSMMLTSSTSLSVCPPSSSSSSLIYNQNQRQRFYIDTLASVAASFLRDLQNNNTTTTSITSVPTITNNNSNSNNNSIKNVINNLNQQQKTSPPPKSQTNIALIQPPSSTEQQDNNTSTASSNTTTTHILPLDTVLQRLNEEQANKTRKLLSDLNSTKRRTRHRKQIMVVNTSNSSASATRNVLLPKLNFLSNDIITDNNNSPQQQQQQQNIVLSGPVAAVARQIVNTNNTTTNNNNAFNNMLSSNTSSSAYVLTNNKSQKLEQNNFYNNNNNNINDNNLLVNNNDQYIILSNYDQNQLPEAFDTNTNYSNLMPQFFASLTTIATENSTSNSNNSNNNNNNNIDNNQIETTAAATILMNNEMIGSPQTLADMSLLDMSINNADSFFGTSVQASTNSIKLKQDQTTSEGPGAFSGLKLDKTSSNNNLCGNFSHKQRSDIIVEWTDSMNDVSLTGILNEFQSPDKHHMHHNLSKNITHALNENSRDSIFFNMDTIMDINNH